MNTGAALERPGRAAAGERFVPLLVMVAVMWAVEVIDVLLRGRLDGLGIRPRQLQGVLGIVFAPFLHDGFVHLVTNTVPFVILGGAIALSGSQRFLTVTVVVAVVGGSGTWLLGGANTVHVGASGLVFGYVTYLVARGFFARRITYVLGGFVVVVLYGGVLWGVVPRPGISWQGHLFGAVGGVVAAAVVHGDRGASGPRASGATVDGSRQRRWYEPPELP